MTFNSILLIIILTILSIILFYLVLFLLKEYKRSFLIKRFEDFSLQSKDKETPFFDNLYISFWKLIKKINKYLEKSVFIKNYSKRFEKYIKYDNNEFKTGYDYISIKFIISLIFGLLYIITSLLKNNFNLSLLIIILFLSFFILDIYYSFEYKRRIKKIENDLLSAIIIMNNAFKSGMNIIQAVDIVIMELEGPIKDEFKKISMDIQYGLSLEIVFERFYNRVKLDSVKYITSSLSLINKTGGNIVKIFSAIEKNFYDKKKLTDELNSLTASSIFMFRLLVFMPIILFILLLTLNKEYFMPLIATNLGRIVMLVIILLYIIYIFIIKRIMKVDV